MSINVIILLIITGIILLEVISYTILVIKTYELQNKVSKIEDRIFLLETRVSCKIEKFNKEHQKSKKKNKEK